MRVQLQGVPLFFLLISGLIFFIPSSLFAIGDVSVMSSIDVYSAYENQLLKGTITVTHDQKEQVDIGSFLLDKKPVQVEFLQDIRISSNSPLLISTYQFTLPAKAAGLYVLPEVSVVVGGKKYHSIMSSYEVKGGGASPMPPPAAQSSNGQAGGQSSQALNSDAAPFLRLEAFVDAKKPLYPGQKTRFVYRYFFNADVGLTKELLPLLDAEGFFKIGDKESKDISDKGASIREIYQVVEAVTPGQYTFGPSVIEGYTYRTSPGGKPIYSSNKLSSEAPAVDVSVIPFPESGKPASFSGAIGKFQLESSLASNAKMRVGDEAVLSVDISGDGDLSTVHLPDLSRQPGFSGFFRMSDLPPVGKVDGNTKHFEVALRPITEAIQEIPRIIFSFFDPLTGKYGETTGKSIPITVIADNDAQDRGNGIIKAAPKPAIPQPKIAYNPAPIEIQSNFDLNTSDLYNKIFGTWWVFAIIPFGIAVLIYETSLKEYLEKVGKDVKQETSGDLYSKFLSEKRGSSSYFDLLNRVLELKLTESSSARSSQENLSQDPAGKIVKDFLENIERKRFAGSGVIDFEALEVKLLSILDELDKLRGDQ